MTGPLLNFIFWGFNNALESFDELYNMVPSEFSETFKFGFNIRMVTWYPSVMRQFCISLLWASAQNERESTRVCKATPHASEIPISSKFHFLFV